MSMNEIKQDKQFAPEVGQSVGSFRIEAVEDLPEIESVAYAMSHPSGAQLIYLQNDDPVMAFAVGFKTPPADDTGVFHIIEHSVLCGSRKFPVKDPFVHLRKASMSTFLNAMTGQDLTIYPVASMNMKDLMNLADVYMDAVFHPLMVENPDIFRQEAWRLESDGENLSVNGVVYSEMRDSLGEAHRLKHYWESKLLCPDVAEGQCSGGYPSAIRQLTYEQFVDTYKRHYRLDNCLIALYGPLDVEGMLTFLDQEYLMPVAAEQAQQQVGAPNPNLTQESQRDLHAQVDCPNLGCPEKVTYLRHLGAIVEDSAEVYAVGMLLGAVFAPGSPSQKRIVDQGVCTGFSATVSPGRNAYVSVEARMKECDMGDAFLEAFLRECRRVVNEGVDREAVISFAQQCYAQSCIGSPSTTQALDLITKVFSGWNQLRGCSMAPFKRGLRYERLLEDAKEEGYLERLMSQYVLKEGFPLKIVFRDGDVPDLFREKEFLEKKRSELGEAGLQAVAAAAADFTKRRQQPDAPEALATLPMLTLDDLTQAPGRRHGRLVELDGLSYARLDIPLHGVFWVARDYDIKSLSCEDYQLISIFRKMLGRTATAHHSIEELAAIPEASFSMGGGGAPQRLDGSGEVRYCVSFGLEALVDRAHVVPAINEEVLRETLFDDEAQIERTIRTNHEAFAAQAAHGMSDNLLRATTHSGAVVELVHGASKGELLSRLVEELDSPGGIQAICARIRKAFAALAQCPLVTIFVGTDEAFAAYHQANLLARRKYADCPDEKGNLGKALPLVEAHEKENVAVVASVPLANCTLHIQRDWDCAVPESWDVAGKAITTDFLWDEVRVKGGAYGAAFMASEQRVAFFSRADPHIAQTFDAFRRAADWLATVELSEEELTGYKMSCLAEFDAPRPFVFEMHDQEEEIFSGENPAFREMRRQMILDTTVESLHEQGRLLQELVKEGACGVTASREAIEASGMDFRIYEF